MRSVRSVFGYREDDLLRPVTIREARSVPVVNASHLNGEKGPRALMAFHFVMVPIPNWPLNLVPPVPCLYGERMLPF